MGKRKELTEAKETALALLESERPGEVAARRLERDITLPGDPREETRALERKAEAIRREVDLLIAEADRRRHRPLARSLRNHPLTTAGVVVALGAGAAGLTVWLYRRYQKRHSLSGRMTELGRAAARVVRRPEKIARQDPSLPMKLVAAFGTSFVGALAKRGASGLLPSRKAQVPTSGALVPTTLPVLVPHKG